MAGKNVRFAKSAKSTKATKKPYKLKLTKLEFLSSCDVPAQGVGGAALMVKSNDAFTLAAKVSKLDDALGLVFGYAFATSLDGGKTPHVDSQSDAIDPDFLKTVTAFIEAGGATDVNHDFEHDGKIVYAWPLLPEINKAMGIEANVVGLAVAVKPSAETYAKFKSGELTGFSIAGTGIREPLEKGRVAKATLYTDEVMGHQHTVSLDECGYSWVSYATMEGAEDSHTHGCIFENGTITILADSGHSHVLAEGQPSVVAVPEGAIVVIAQRAQQSVSPTKNAPPARDVNTKSTRPTPTPQGDAMEPIVLTEAQFAHYKTLTKAAAEAFLKMSEAERESVVAKALEADPVMIEFNGQSYRKSAGPAVIELARSAKAQAEIVAKQAEAIEKGEVRKQAAELLAGMPGDDDTHDFIVASLRKGDAEKAKKAFEAIKGIRSTSNLGKKAPGFGGEDPKVAELPHELLRKRVEKYQVDNKVPTYEQALGLAVQHDPEAQRLYNEARN